MNNILILNPPVSIGLKYKLNLKNLLIINIILIVGFLVFYFFQINEMVRNNYLIKDYEGNLAGINQENLVLENNFLKFNSLDTIENLAKNLNFEKVGEVRYLESMGSQVVAK